MRRRGTGDYFPAADYSWMFYPQPYRFIAKVPGPGGVTPDYAPAASMGLTTRALGGLGVPGSSPVPYIPPPNRNPYGPHTPNMPPAVWKCLQPYVPKNLPPNVGWGVPNYLLQMCEASVFQGLSGLGCGCGGSCHCGGKCGGVGDFGSVMSTIQTTLTNPVTVLGFTFPLWIGLAGGIAAVALMKGTRR